MAANFFTYEVHQGEEFVGVPPNSHAAGLFGADARALAPGVTQLGVPYHLMEAFALCFVQHAILLIFTESHCRQCVQYVRWSSRATTSTYRYCVGTCKDTVVLSL